MISLFSNLRFYILSLNAFIILGVYIFILITTPSGSIQIIKLTQIFALLGLLHLYLAILAGPFTRIFISFPLRSQYLHARRSLGVSAFFYGLIHASLAFFGQLGSFQGLWFLPNKYLLAVSLSFSALLILSLMAATSFDFMVTKLTFSRWKKLHRLVYLAFLFILIHALLLGTHFSDLSTLIPTICYIALVFLLILEGYCLDKYLQTKQSILPQFGISILIVLIFISGSFGYYITSLSGGAASIGVHSQHIQLAKDIQNNNLQNNTSPSNIPSLQGDRLKRFTVSFDHDEKISPNTKTILKFKVFDASSGNQVQFFSNIYSKVMHLIIVDKKLEVFQHIHPTQMENEFSIEAEFSKSDRYHLYLDFQPLGAIEQQFAFTLDVGDIENVPIASQQPDANLLKNTDGFGVSLNYEKPLYASKLSLGQQTLNFSIADGNNQPVTTLKPYLASFGHLVMINQATYEYLHVHPTNLTPPKEEENGGPDVQFLPLGLYSPIKPGIYRLFAQFNPDNKLILVDFTVNVE